MKIEYVVLHQNDDGSFESTYFKNHKSAFAYCESKEVKIKGVYKVISRNPMVLGAINIFCSFDDQYCVLEQHFKSEVHKIEFRVI